jgi:translation elongation factor EF-G
MIWLKSLERIKNIEIIAMYDQGKSGYWISEFKD